MSPGGQTNVHLYNPAKLFAFELVFSQISELLDVYALPGNYSLSQKRVSLSFVSLILPTGLNCRRTLLVSWRGVVSTVKCFTSLWAFYIHVIGLMVIGGGCTCNNCS